MNEMCKYFPEIDATKKSVECRLLYFISIKKTLGGELNVTGDSNCPLIDNGLSDRNCRSNRKEGAQLPVMGLGAIINRPSKDLPQAYITHQAIRENE